MQFLFWLTCTVIFFLILEVARQFQRLENNLVKMVLFLHYVSSRENQPSDLVASNYFTLWAVSLSPLLMGKEASAQDWYLHCPESWILTASENLEGLEKGSEPKALNASSAQKPVEAGVQSHVGSFSVIKEWVSLSILPSLLGQTLENDLRSTPALFKCSASWLPWKWQSCSSRSCGPVPLTGTSQASVLWGFFCWWWWLFCCFQTGSCCKVLAGRCLNNKESSLWRNALRCISCEVPWVMSWKSRSGKPIHNLL